MEGESVINMFFLLNEVVRFAPLYIDEDLGKHCIFTPSSEDKHQFLVLFWLFSYSDFFFTITRKKCKKS